MPGTPPLGLAYCWHGKWYLGAAHGTAGVLQVLLLWMAADLAAADRGAAASAGAALAAGAAGQASPPSGDAISAAAQPEGWDRQAAAAMDGMLQLMLPGGNLPSSLGNDSDR